MFIFSNVEKLIVRGHCSILENGDIENVLMVFYDDQEKALRITGECAIENKPSAGRVQKIDGTKDTIVSVNGTEIPLVRLTNAVSSTDTNQQKSRTIPSAAFRITGTAIREIEVFGTHQPSDVSAPEFCVHPRWLDPKHFTLTGHNINFRFPNVKFQGLSINAYRSRIRMTDVSTQHLDLACFSSCVVGLKAQGVIYNMCVLADSEVLVDECLEHVSFSGFVMDSRIHWHSLAKYAVYGAFAFRVTREIIDEGTEMQKNKRCKLM